MADKRIKEAVDLFEEVMIYGTERVLRGVNDPLWKEYSPEQLQLLKLIRKEGRVTSGRLAGLQAVHKSAISNRVKKLLQKELVRIVETGDRREKLLELTAEGERIIEQSDRALHEYVHQLLIAQVEDEEIDQFLRIFRKLKEIIKTDGV